MLDSLKNVSVIPKVFPSYESLNYYCGRYFSLDSPTCAKILNSCDDKFYFVKVLDKLDPTTQKILTSLKIASYVTILIPLFVLSLALVSRLKMGHEPGWDFLGKELYYDNPNRFTSLFIENLHNIPRAKALYAFDPNVLLDKTPPCHPFKDLTPLEYACKTSNLEAIKWLYPKNPSLKALAKTFFTFCTLKDQKNLQSLYDLDARVLFEEDYFGNSGFACLCQYNNLDIVKKLTTTWDFTKIEHKLAFEEGFHAACSNGHKDLIDHLYNMHPTPISFEAFFNLCYTSYSKNTKEALGYLCDIPAIKAQILLFVSQHPRLRHLVKADVQDFLKTKGIYLFNTNCSGTFSAPPYDNETSRASILFEKILGADIKPTSQIQVRKAYKKRALELHPDKTCGSDTPFKELTQAWQLLQLTPEYQNLPKS